jgi:hypothetical protein
MKKSNILLVSAFFLAFTWIILIGCLAASEIKNHLQGKEPCFARTHQQYLESRKKIFPVPVSELCISVEGMAVITILAGKELTVLAHPKTWNCIYTDLKNGKSMIIFKRLMEYNDPITITIPEIPSLSLDNFSEVNVKGLDRKEIHFQCKQVGSFTASSCKITTLSLEFPGNKDHQDIYIDKSNEIGTLIASVKGSGKIRLETIGQLTNQISLSDSVHIEATYDMMKQLSMGQVSRVLNK